jgi:Zn-dependent protease with chaperone function
MTVMNRLADKEALARSSAGRSFVHEATAPDPAGIAVKNVIRTYGDEAMAHFGALTPRAAVSRGLFEGFAANELQAVLEHERYHVRNLDPLKVLVVRALPATFFFLPALGALRTRYVAARELAADRRAVQACGRKPLVAALMKVVRGPAWSELEVAPSLAQSRQSETGVGGLVLQALLERLAKAGGIRVVHVCAFSNSTASSSRPAF